MNTRFYNCKILTLCKDDEILENCELWVEGNKIAYIGKPKENPISFDREIDCNGNLVMPSFKNGHGHGIMTFCRSIADDLPLDKWLNEKIFPMENNLDLKSCYWFYKLAIMEYLSSGISTSFEMYLIEKPMAENAIDTGFRTIICGAINDFAQNPDEIEDMYKFYNSLSPLLSFEIGFHAEYTTSLDIMKKISTASHNLKAPVFTHCAETESEVKGCIERHSKTPVELFDSLGLFDYGGGIFHGVHLTDNDIEILNNKNVLTVTNPAANCKLSSGVADVCKLLESNVPVALGTDGPGGNNALDMFREMYLVTALQKIKTGNPQALPPIDVLKMACSALPKALHIDNDCLSVGKLADIIVIDLHQPNMQPINNIADNIVYSGSKSNVALTMVDGKILYENGKFYIDKDAELVYEKCNKAVKGLI